ncbi:unnamed protein product [Oppiella nova]|uniref:Uncharacterized protein n=1 Tax=Oppiella nova TaxID=334625 RepID=A0A7R9LVY2_9ACAR|nr:unnamed protein product [Oppiella nova]CAG2167433.1 unnamed protein product [Oppiella nova]
MAGTGIEGTTAPTMPSFMALMLSSLCTSVSSDWFKQFEHKLRANHCDEWTQTPQPCAPIRDHRVIVSSGKPSRSAVMSGARDVVSSQETILEQYFTLNAVFLWDKAKEMVEKERDSHRHQQNQSSIMSSMMTALAQLSLADKNYIHLHFLAPKGFLRKDVVKGMYETLRSEFERLHDRGNTCASTEPRQASTTPSTPITTAAVPANIPSATSSSSSSILSIAVSLSSALMSTTSANSQSVPNSPIKATLEVLDRLAAHICGQLLWYVRARIEMMDIYEKITIVSNQKAVKQIKCSIANKTQFLGSNVSESRGSTASELHSQDNSLSAASLPMDVSTQVSNSCSNDMKTVCSKQSIDYIQKVITFQRKTDAQFVALLFDTHGLEDYKGFGYHSPYKSFESPKGIDSIPIIYSYPLEVPKSHLPTLIMIMNNKSKELNTSDSLVPLFDSQLNCTYFLIRPDPRITLKH